MFVYLLSASCEQGLNVLHLTAAVAAMHSASRLRDHRHCLSTGTDERSIQQDHPVGQTANRCR